MSRVLILVGLLACGSDGGSDAATDVEGDTPSPDSAVDAVGDVGSDAPTDSGMDAPPDSAVDAPSDSPSVDVGPEPLGRIWPEPGSLTIIQIRLSGVFQLGEAGVLVGPDGSVVLMDVGNRGHVDEVAGLVRDLNTRWVTRARGFPRDRAPLEVDWVVLTHIHGDHVGGFEDLVGEGLSINRGVVHRGFVDLGNGMNENDFEELCGLMRGSLAAVDVPLCTASDVPPCDADALMGVHPATACDGLLAGDLSDPLGGSGPSFIPLGDGARMNFVASDGHVSNGTTTDAITFGHEDTNQENARSIVSLVSHGPFRYHWGGDLTGSGDATEPDVESHLVRVAGAEFYQTLGVDVTHAHHHVRRTSSNTTFVDAMAPNDGLSRNVVGGINGGHVGSPHGDVLMRFGDADRLGEGRIWITMSATGGDAHPALVDADADVTLQTLDGGRQYRIQASRAEPFSLTFDALR